MRQNHSLVSFGFVAALASSLFVVACGGDESNGGADPDDVTSVDSDKKVSDLSDSEAKEYCEDGQSFAEGEYAKFDMKKITCGLIAQAFAGSGAETDEEAKAACRDALESCLQQPDEPTPPSEDDCSSFATDAKECSATVGEVNKCYTDQINQLKALEGKDFCAEAKATSSETPDIGFEQPASCKAIATKCPSLAGDSGDEG